MGVAERIDKRYSLAEKAWDKARKKRGTCESCLGNNQEMDEVRFHSSNWLCAVCFFSVHGSSVDVRA